MKHYFVLSLLVPLIIPSKFSKIVYSGPREMRHLKEKTQAFQEFSEEYASFKKEQQEKADSDVALNHPNRSQ